MAWLKCAGCWEQPTASTVTSSGNVGTFIPEDVTHHRHCSQKLRSPAVGLTNGETVKRGKIEGKICPGASHEGMYGVGGGYRNLAPLILNFGTGWSTEHRSNFASEERAPFPFHRRFECFGKEEFLATPGLDPTTRCFSKRSLSHSLTHSLTY